MKSLLLSIFAAATFIAANAQSSNVIFFTEDGEKFTVILNGARQNDTPETQVKVTGLNTNSYKLKVIFEDPANGTMDKNLWFNEGMETAFNIKKNKKGEWVLRPISETPVAQAPPAPASQTVVVYNPDPAPAPAAQQTTTITTTTTTGGAAPATGVGINMGVQVDEETGSFNMNVSGFEHGTTTSSSTMTTTTSTTVTSTGAPAPAPVHTPPPSYLPGYTGPIGCPVPMSQGEFQNVKNSISSKTFEDSKNTIARQVIGSNCLLTSQVKEIMMLFTFEDTKLDLAKFAYGYTYDIGNYYMLNDAFTFESSIDELNSYIQSRR